VIITTDDVCPENLKFWQFWEQIKVLNPDIKVIAFVIANFKGEQRVDESEEFQQWFEQTRDWVEVGVHGYDHEFPPEWDRDDAPELVERALEILRPYLPKDYLYRPPGFQRTIHLEPCLRELGFAGVAYQRRFRYFYDNGSVRIVEGVLNSHCCDMYENPITRWREWFPRDLIGVPTSQRF
jgi:predicted deacetylase